MPFAQPERHLAGVVDGLADERVAAREKQRLLDADGVVADHVHHQLHVTWLRDVPVHTVMQAL